MWNTIVLLIGLLLLTSPARAKEHYINTLQDRHGEAIGGVSVTVYLAGTLTPASLFSDNLGTVKSNPFLSDSDGSYDFYAANGVYDFHFVRSGYTFNDLDYARIALFDLNDGGIGGTPTDDTILVGDGTTYVSTTLPSCSDPTTSKLLYNTSSNSFTCGTDQGTVGGTFDTLGSGTNSTATMVVSTGAALTFSGSGTVNASSYRGNALVATADGGTGLSTSADDTVLVGAGGTYAAATLPSCSNATTSKLLYDTGTNAFSCGTDQSSGGGTTFDTIGNGTNTTASAMTVGTGAALGVTGTGNVTSTISWPNKVTVDAGNSPYTALTTDGIIFCDTSAAGRTITLPAATSRVILTFYNVGSNSCTINRAGADIILTGITNYTSFIIRNAGSTFWFEPDGASIWFVGG